MVFFVYYVKKNKYGNARIVRLLETFVYKGSAKRFCKKHSSKHWGEELAITYGHVENVKMYKDARKYYVIEERSHPHKDSSMSPPFHMITYVNKLDDDDYQDEVLFLCESLDDAEEHINSEALKLHKLNNDVIVYQGRHKDVYKYYKPGSYIVIEEVTPKWK